MSQIKAKNTRPEIIVRKYLFRQGYRFRIHDSNLPGKPDIVLAKYKTIIFVHGCFWHGHDGCKYFVIPKTRTEWWKSKINRTKQLDDISVNRLKESGWNLIVVYECQLRREIVELTLEQITNQLEVNGNTSN